jgi:hypothetical protein
MLFRLAGDIPDDLLSQSRIWNAAGRHADVGRAVGHAAMRQWTALSDEDLDLVAGLMTGAGTAADGLALARPADAVGAPPHGFAPSRAAMTELLDDAAGPAPLVGSYPAAAEPEDAVCAAAVHAVEAEPDGLALWRAWRFPFDRAPWPSPRRVYLVEAGPGADLVTITDRVQRALAAAGESWPQVEAYQVGAVLPGYQRQARAGGALLWARDPDPGVQVAQLWPEPVDGADPAAPDGYPKLPVARCPQVAAYLAAGEPVLVTDEQMADPFDPEEGGTVSLDLVTDGYWIWPRALAHFVLRYQLSPDPLLVSHLEQRGYEFPRVDGAAMHRALAVLGELDDGPLAGATD